MPVTIDNLVTSLITNQCVLLVGPHLHTPQDEDAAHLESYCESLKEKLTSLNISFDSGSQYNPYYLAGKLLNGRPEMAAWELETARHIFSKGSNIYTLLAALPFNTIVNFGSDHLIQKAISGRGYDYITEHYNYKKGERAYTNTDPKAQMVFNLFGSLDDPESRPRTEQEQLQFLKAIINTTKLPDDFLSRIDSTEFNPKSYVFIGFDFELWPYRLLFDALRIPKTDKSVSARDSQISIMTKDYYTDRFGIAHENSSPLAFIRSLHEKYSTQVRQHLEGILAYRAEDEDVYNGIWESLNTSNLVVNRKFQFWKAADIVPGDVITEEEQKKLDKSTVYIAIISNKFINDPTHQAQLKAMMARPEVLIIVVLKTICNWHVSFPELEKRADLILPKRDTYIKNSGNEPKPEDYFSISKAIESKIR